MVKTCVNMTGRDEKPTIQWSNVKRHKKLTITLKIE